MATKEEHPERYGWWLNELESLGISANRISELNDLNEVSSLAENIKRGFYQEYESGRSFNSLEELEEHKREGNKLPNSKSSISSLL
jgi:hypothetical protein